MQCCFVCGLLIYNLLLYVLTTAIYNQLLHFWDYFFHLNLYCLPYDSSADQNVHILYVNLMGVDFLLFPAGEQREKDWERKRAIEDGERGDRGREGVIKNKADKGRCGQKESMRDKGEGRE